MIHRDTALAAMSRLPDGGRFVALDSLRGLAALGVVAHHLCVHGAGPLFQIVLFANGQLFVDFFFVLSGFVLAGAYGARLADGFPVGRYMLLRLGRVYPLHLALVAVYVALEILYYLLQADGWAIRQPFTDERSLSSLLQSLFFTAVLFEPLAYIWNAPSWSIAVEVWLYLILALGFRLLPRKAGWAVFPAIALVLAVLVGSGFNGWFTPLSLMMARGLLGFGLGVSAWLLFCRIRPWLGRLSGLQADMLEVMAVLAIYGAVCWSWLWSANLLGSVLLFAFAVIVFASEAGRISRLLHMRSFVWLGTLSYSLYMTHMMLMGRLIDVLRFFGLGKMVMTPEGPMRMIDAPGPLADAFSLAILAVCLPVAWLAWRLIENPARLWSRKKAAEWGAGVEERRAPTI